MVVSMTKLNIKLWGRDFSLPLVYQCDSDETVLDSQIQACELLSAAWGAVEDSLTAIEGYCLKRDGEQIGTSIPNIFKYVVPVEILVLRDGASREVALLCNYRFDPEHGLAAVFKNEKLLKVIPQDEL